MFEQKKDVLDLLPELPTVERVVRIDFSYVEGLMSQLELGFTKVKTVVEGAKKKNLDSGPMGDEDPMPSILTDFLREVEPKVKELKVRNIACFFCTSALKISPLMVMSQYLSFIPSYDISVMGRSCNLFHSLQVSMCVNY